METIIGLAILVGIIYTYAYLRNRRIAKQKEIEAEKERRKKVKDMFDKSDKQLKEHVEQQKLVRNFNRPLSSYSTLSDEDDREKRKREALRGETTTRTNDYTPIIISSSGIDYDYTPSNDRSDFDGFGSGGSFGGGGASGSWSDDSSSSDSSSSDSGSSDCGGGSDD